jgi:hypothetical protein
MSQLPSDGILKRLPVQPRVTIVSALLVVLALVSALVLSPFFSSADTYHDMFEKLDEKKTTVLTLSAAAAATSAVLTAIPDDTCTPIAERMSEISKDFTIVLAAILLEKYLVTTLGFVFFTGVIPLCCVLFISVQFMRKDERRRQQLIGITSRLFMFGLVLFIATPTSVFVASKIDETYQSSIDKTIEATQRTAIFLDTANKEVQRKEPDNPLEYIQQRFEDLQATADNVVNNISSLVDWVKEILNDFIEAFAVMIVTSFVIPILVPLVIYLAFKLLFGQQQIVIIDRDDSSQTRGSLPRGGSITPDVTGTGTTRISAPDVTGTGTTRMP